MKKINAKTAVRSLCDWSVIAHRIRCPIRGWKLRDKERGAGRAKRRLGEAARRGPPLLWRDRCFTTVIGRRCDETEALRCFGQSGHSEQSEETGSGT